MEITKKDLNDIYRSYSNKEAAEKLGISSATLVKYIKKSGIKQKGKGNRAISKTKITIID